jgi:hypothetical protein
VAPYFLSQVNGFACEMTDSVFYNNLYATSASNSAYGEAIARGVLGGTYLAPTNASNNVVASASPIRAITRASSSIKGGSLVMRRVTNLDPRPANDALTSAAYAPNDGFFSAAHYRGAFAPGCNWLFNWTASNAYGITPAPTPAEGWQDLGYSLGGLTGDPVLGASGTLASGTSIAITDSNARPASLAVYVFGLAELYLPIFGGTIVPNFNTLGNVIRFTDGSGNDSWSFGPIPAGFPSNTPVLLQCGILDAAAPAGVAFSNACVRRTP